MTLIFDDPCLDRRQFGYLMALRIAYRLRLFNLGGQMTSAVPTLRRQHWPNLVHFFSRYLGPVTSAMAGLSSYFPLALLLPATSARRACQSIGGRRLGGVRGVLLAERKLPLQIGNMLFLLGNLPVILGDLPFILSQSLRLLVQPLRLLGHSTAQAFIFMAQGLVFEA